MVTKAGEMMDQGVILRFKEGVMVIILWVGTHQVVEDLVDDPPTSHLICSIPSHKRTMKLVIPSCETNNSSTDNSSMVSDVTTPTQVTTTSPTSTQDDTPGNLVHQMLSNA